MRDYELDEVYGDYKDEKIESLQRQIEDLEIELETVTTDLRWFLKRFIEKGNEEGKTLEQAYAEMFEIYKEYEYEKYVK